MEMSAQKQWSVPCARRRLLYLTMGVLCCSLVWVGSPNLTQVWSAGRDTANVGSLEFPGSMSASTTPTTTAVFHPRFPRWWHPASSSD